MTALELHPLSVNCDFVSSLNGLPPSESQHFSFLIRHLRRGANGDILFLAGTPSITQMNVLESYGLTRARVTV